VRSWRSALLSAALAAVLSVLVIAVGSEAFHCYDSPTYYDPWGIVVAGGAAIMALGVAAAHRTLAMSLILCGLLIVVLALTTRPYFACAQFEHFARTTEVTDADLVALARDTVEAREFQRRFGVSSTTVDRSGRTAIDFRSGHVRLRVFMADGPRAVDSFLDCPGRRLASTNVVEAIRAAGC
jgi:hypothetical protein